MRFPGFDSQGGSTAVPDAFFNELLPVIDHLGELKVSLYAIRSVERRNAPQPYVDAAEMLADRALVSGFGDTAEARAIGLTDALERAVVRGTLLRADTGGHTLYLINSPRGRAALKGLEQGRWVPEAPAEIEEPAPARPNIFQLYEKNIGPLTPILVDILKEAEKQYPPEWIEEAIGIALKNNVRKWRYVEAILQARGEKEQMTEKIEKPLKRAAENISKASSKTSSNDEAQPTGSVASNDEASSRDEAQPAGSVASKGVAQPSGDASSKDVSSPAGSVSSKDESPPTGGAAPSRKAVPDGNLGDPDCPHCHGIGYLSYDVPVGHPEFGKLHVCTCREADVEAQARERLYALSNLDELENLTFENFSPRGRIGVGPFQADSIENAYNQARHFARNHKDWLILQGGFGCGKTHLAAAITNEAASLGVPALFITVPDLLDQLRFAYQSPEETFEQRFETVRRSPLLILDDFGTQNATEWAEEKLFQIINYRYTNRLPMVVTTNLPLEDIEPRIRSRLQDPELVTRVTIMAPDYRRPADDTGHHELSSLPHFTHLTFGNFEERRTKDVQAADARSLERAFKSARQFAEQPNGWLVLMGSHGTGKTHLAAAIGNYRAGLGYPPLLVSVPDLLDDLRATFAPENRSRYDRQFNHFKDEPLLLLDDLGRQSMTNWVREKLNQLFNHRYVRELPTVITTSDTLENLYKNEPYIASRMLDKRVSRIYALTVPPYRFMKK